MAKTLPSAAIIGKLVNPGNIKVSFHKGLPVEAKPTDAFKKSIPTAYMKERIKRIASTTLAMYAYQVPRVIVFVDLVNSPAITLCPTTNIKKNANTIMLKRIV
jgi:hypothetical protein